MALGRALGWLWYIRAGSELIPVLISVSREAHASWATIITERDGDSYLSIPRYLGMLWLLGRRMGAYLFSTTSFPLDTSFPPLTSYLFSTIGSTGYLPLFL